MQKRSMIFRRTLNITTILGFVLLILLLFYGYQANVFSSPEKLKSFVLDFGIWAPFVFICIQAVQVVVPILPGSMGCVAGVIAFGPGMGFLYNYIGICAGSVAAFLLAKQYGREFVKLMTKEKQYVKYENWLQKGNKFDWLFAIAIFLPVAPDDLLCYLAGLKGMGLGRFLWIILLGKPMALWLYSMGVTSLLTWIMNAL